MVQVELVFVNACHLDEHEPNAGKRQNQDKPWVNFHLPPASRAAYDEGEYHEDECQDPHNRQKGKESNQDCALKLPGLEEFWILLQHRYPLQEREVFLYHAACLGSGSSAEQTRSAEGPRGKG